MLLRASGPSESAKKIDKCELKIMLLSLVIYINKNANQYKLTD